MALLAWVGCIADSYELAALFGDDIDYRREAQLIDKTGWPLVAFVTRRAGGAGASLLTRARVAAACLAEGRAGMARLVRAHCETTGDLAARFGLGPRVREALRQTYERWDGKGLPAGLRGMQLTVATRIVTLAGTLEVFHRLGGVNGAVDVARGRSGSHFSPALVEMFCADANSVFEGLDGTSTWDMVIDAEPGLRRRLNAAELDTALEALADYIDLKSPYTLGHSRGVADLAEAAACRMGLADDQVRLVRRAGLMHDLGKVGIPNEILDKPAPLTAAEIERVRLHPYLVERMLARVAARHVGVTSPRVSGRVGISEEAHGDLLADVGPRSGGRRLLHTLTEPDRIVPPGRRATRHENLKPRSPMAESTARPRRRCCGRRGSVLGHYRHGQLG